MNESILQRYCDEFNSGRELPEADGIAFFDALLAEQDEALLSDLFTAWRNKGTTTNEIYTLAEIMRDRCIRVKSRHESFVDVVGTGGSRTKTFNVSTAASFVVAGAGIAVAKHGNRAATSKSGSADVLSALGIEPAMEPAVAERCLNEIGICFMFAPKFHALSAVLAKVRRELGFATIFNNLGPLCNPAGAPHQLIGVYDPSLVEKTANALARLGTKRSWVVHGEDGLDEISLNGKTVVAEIEDMSVRTFEISAADFGMNAAPLNGLRAESPAASAEVVREVLEGKRTDSAAESLVLINAAAAIYLTGRAETLSDAAALALESIKNGGAHAKLSELANASAK